MLAELYDAWVEQERGQYQSGFKGRRFRASSLGSCHRQQMLDRTQWPARPWTVGKRRMMHDRTLVHDEHVRAWEWAGKVLATEHRMYNRILVGENMLTAVTAPRGYTGKFDALLHAECCDTPIRDLRAAWRIATSYQQALPGMALEAVKVLRRHRLTLVDAKTVHPNIINFASTLPKRPNVLQLTYYAMALADDPGLVADTRLDYIPVGGETGDLEYVFDWADHADEVLAEMAVMDLWWLRWRRDKRHGVPFRERTLPPVLPLELNGPDRDGKLRLQQSWQCGYCDFAGVSCHPCYPVYKGGDWLGTVEGDTVRLRWDRPLRERYSEDQVRDIMEAAGWVVPTLDGAV